MTEICFQNDWNQPHTADFILDLANRMNVWTYLPRRFASPCQQLGATSSNSSRHRHPRFTGTRLLEKKQVISLQGNSQPSQRRVVTVTLQGTDKGEDTLNSWGGGAVCSSSTKSSNAECLWGWYRSSSWAHSLWTLCLRTSRDHSFRRSFYFVRQPRSSIRHHFPFTQRLLLFCWIWSILPVLKQIFYLSKLSKACEATFGVLLYFTVDLN